MKIQSKIILSLIVGITLILVQDSFAQRSAGSDSKQELVNIIDIPTAGILESGFLGLSFDVLPGGTLISKVNIAIIRNFSIGISFGASNFIGTGNINFYDLPGFHAKFRVFTETRALPSFTFGFNSQGKGLFVDSLKRYEIKSPGVYFAISKNYKFLGYLSFHGVVNYSLENSDGDDNLNFGVGIEKTIGPSISVVAEYDFANNDNSVFSLGKGKGYLNLGVRWSAAIGLTLGIDVRNLVDNKYFQSSAQPERALFINYNTKLY